MVWRRPWRGQERHPPARDGGQEHAVGRRSVGRVDLRLADVVEQRVEPRSAEDADLREIRHQPPPSMPAHSRMGRRGPRMAGMTDDDRDRRPRPERLLARRLAPPRGRAVRRGARHGRRRTRPPPGRPGAAEREALYRDHPSSPVPAAGAGDVPGAALAVRRPAAVRGRRRAPGPGVRARRPRRSRPPQQRRRRRSPSTASARVAPAAARRRGVARRCSGCAATRAACSCRSAMRPAATRRTAPAATSSTRARARTSAATRPPARIVVDLNFSFQPSCAFDPRWACPLAPPENRLTARIEAGERLADR